MGQQANGNICINLREKENVIHNHQTVSFVLVWFLFNTSPSLNRWRCHKIAFLTVEFYFTGISTFYIENINFLIYKH
jgi:hypothetical protein